MKKMYCLPKISINMFKAEILTASEVTDGVDIIETSLKNKSINIIDKRNIETLRFTY